MATDNVAKPNLRVMGEKWLALPLHPGPLLSQWWYACSEPERPGDQDMCVDPRCEWCVVKTRVELEAGRNLGYRGWEDGDGRMLPLTWPEFAQTCIDFRGLADVQR